MKLSQNANILIDSFIDFNGMSIHLGLLYVYTYIIW